MKRFLTALVFILLSLSLALVLSSCAFLENFTGTEPPDVPPSSGETPVTPPDKEPSGDISAFPDDPQTPPDSEVHTHVWSDWKSDNEMHYKTCGGCDEITEKALHNVVTEPGRPATCVDEGLTNGSHCSVCEHVISAPAVIPPTDDHSYVNRALILPTFTQSGAVSGKVCTVCHDITDADEELPAFINTCALNAYGALAELSNGTEMRQAYKKLLYACGEWHDDPTADGTQDDEYWTAFTVDFSEFHISGEDCFTLWKAILADCPLFYWIAPTAYARGSELILHVDPAYADGETRVSYNEIIYRAIVTTEQPSTTTYEKALFLHDTIINSMSYAYEADGVTPEDAQWAHSILGYFVSGSGVCECYAETFALFLNYWGIPNMPATGMADGVNHAWNLVKMEDEAWYWFDLTWDDQPTQHTGRIYDYFCKTDSEFALSERTLESALYDYPERGSAAFTGSAPMIGDSFDILDFTYSVIGYREVELNEVRASIYVNVPETVTRPSTDYVFSVTSVGMRDADNALCPVFGTSVKNVTLPKTVQHIRPNAFSTLTIVMVMIDEDNPHLFVSGGTDIYRRAPQSLVCILPSSATKDVVLLAGTVRVEDMAILYNDSIQTLAVPTSVTYIGRQAIYDCSNFRRIDYDGTWQAWESITIGASAFRDMTWLFCDGSVYYDPTTETYYRP